MNTLFRDIRYAIRGLTKRPGFTAVVVLTLALGIGANTAIFSIVNAVILRPLPYRDDARLAILWTDDSKHNVHEKGTSYPTFMDWRNKSQSFADMAIFKDDPLILPSNDETERVMGALVSANLFPLLGVTPVLGRTFSADEEGRKDRVVVLSYRLWQRRFGGSREAIGKPLELISAKGTHISAQVVGVMPAAFGFPNKEVEVWEPATMYWRWDRESADRDFDSWHVIGRLNPQTTVQRAQSEMTAIGQQLAQTYPAISSDFPGFAVNVVPLRDQLAGKNLQLLLWVLLGAVGCVLLIACANVTNLLSARGTARRREFAIRAALGAGRLRLLKQTLTESLVLALGAGFAGLGLAAFAMPGLVALAPSTISRLNETKLDARVLAFATVLSLLSGLVSGLAPAWRASRNDPNDALKSGAREASSELRLHQARGLLIVGECALAVVLLAGAGLLIRSFARLQSVNPGFNSEGVLLVRVSPPLSARSGAQAEAFFLQTRERLNALPGVQAVDTIDDFLIRENADDAITIVGHTPIREGETGPLVSSNVSPGFFQTMGVPLLRGRFLSRADALKKIELLSTPAVQVPPTSELARSAPAEATVINEAFARHFFPGEDPIGKRFYFGVPTKIYWYEIVGVVGDMHRQGLEKQPIPEYFGPHIGGTTDLVLRGGSDPITLGASVRQAIRAVDKNAIITSVMTLESRLGGLNAQRRFQTVLLTLFATIALLLAAIGIYGIMHYSVGQRTHEIGIRMALGAQTSGVLRLVIGQGLKLTLVGTAAGILAAVWLTRFLEHSLFGVGSHDPTTFAAVALLLIGVTIAACYLPARKASKVDPLVALRHE